MWKTINIYIRAGFISLGLGLVLVLLLPVFALLVIGDYLYPSKDPRKDFYDNEEEG